MNCNKCASTKSHARMRPDACTCISRCMICIYLVCLVLAGTIAHRNGLKKSSKLKWNRQSFNKNFLWEIAIDLFPAIKLKGLSVHFLENCMHETEKKKLHHHNIIYIVDSVMGDSRKYPYHTTDGFHVLNPPCLRKFQNALPPHALRIP